MQCPKNTNDSIQQLCGEFGAEDGTDPREFHQFQTKRQGKMSHKQLRLCRQIQQTLSFAISECPNEDLRGLLIESVLPGGGNSHLIVTFRADTEDVEACEEFQLGLSAAEGWFRHEISTAISRRKVPRLSFTVLPSRLPG